MLKAVIEKVIKKENLTETEMIEAMNMIMEGQATDSQIGGFLVALRMKGETVEEITGSAKALRAKAVKIAGQYDQAIDTCGTGGDRSNTFNISTVVALISAAAGVMVVKHGNRSVSSKCGSADVLENLGININMEPEQVQQCVEKANLGFVFAPNYHRAMKYAMGPRKELGVRTIFNVLGPLINPAGVKKQLLGVFDENLVSVIAGVLKELGLARAMVVHGLDGLDEITLTTKTRVSELKDGEILNYYIEPEEYGFSLAKKEELAGGDPQKNVQILLSILDGEKGPKRDMVLLNAGAAIYLGEKAKSLTEGILIAIEMIDSGSARQKLNQLLEVSREISKTTCKEGCR